MDERISPLTIQFLEWLSAHSRTYCEVMDAWRTTCPRLTTWEDALAEGLIEIAGTCEDSPVSLTPRGRTLLNENRKSGSAVAAKAN